MLFEIPPTEVHDVQEYEIISYDSLILRCGDVAMRRGVAHLVLQLYAIIEQLKKEAIENQRRVIDLENDALMAGRRVGLNRGDRLDKSLPTSGEERSRATAESISVDKSQ